MLYPQQAAESKYAQLFTGGILMVVAQFKIAQTEHTFDDQVTLCPVMRKPVFGVCDQGRLKPACAARDAR